MAIHSESDLMKSIFRWLFEPKATFFLIILSVLMFIYQIFFMTEETFTNLVFQPQHLFELNFIPMVASWFMHGSLAHLAGNMLFLFIFGRIIEKNLGSLKLIFIYFISAIVSDVFAAFVALQGGIGASGAIAGLISASILINPFYITYFLFIIPIPIILIGWLAIYTDIAGILNPVQDNIGHFAHLGGYIAVTIGMFFLNRGEKEKMKKGLIVNFIFLILVFLSYLYLKGLF